MPKAYERLSAAVADMRGMVGTDMVAASDLTRDASDENPNAGKHQLPLEAERDFWERAYNRRTGQAIEARTNSARLETALRAIIARADDHKPGTSKVQDMKRLAEAALNEGGRHDEG